MTTLSKISARTRKSIRSSKLDAAEFLNVCAKAGLPAPVLEHRFNPTRMWRFDIAWPRQRIALEIDGGVFVAGRHNSGGGFAKDMEKSNSAAVMGWRILRCQPTHLLRFETVEMVRRAMRGNSLLIGSK